MPQPETVDVAAYVTIVPEWSRSGTDKMGRPILRGAKVEKVTQTMPQLTSRNGAIVALVTFRVDADALLPLLPSAVVHVHAPQVATMTVELDQPDADPED